MMVLGRPGGGTKGGTVLRTTVQDREMCDPGGGAVSPAVFNILLETVVRVIML